MKISKFVTSVKYSLTAVNVLFAITGVYLLASGFGVQAAYQEYERILSNRFFLPAHFLIATGIIIILTTFLGLYGALTENFYIIFGYVVLTVVIFIFELSICLAAYALRGDALAEVRNAMQEILLQYGSRIEITMFWDDMHREFECCGHSGPSGFWNAYREIPVSCCHADYGIVSPMVCDLGNAYTTGCGPILGAWASSIALFMGISGMVVCLMQALLSAAAGWIAWKSRYEEIELES